MKTIETDTRLGLFRAAVRPSLTALLLFMTTLPVWADEISVTYTGFVSSGTTREQGNASGTFCFFGACGIGLDGDPYSLVYQFDTTTAVDSGSLAKGGSYWAVPSVGSATLSINGFSVALDGTFYSSDYSSGGNDTVQIIQQTTDPASDGLGSGNFIGTEGLSTSLSFNFPSSLTTAYDPTNITVEPELNADFSFYLITEAFPLVGNRLRSLFFHGNNFCVRRR